MRLEDAIEIWLASNSKLSFKNWLKLQGLEIVGNGVVLIKLDLRRVDLVKR